ncbi:hypothetical protein L596_021421 [Steinernema carpocapsae]|uniref:Uncharacterized protein n=1 Tax=Steinernema carpocapsae TaxID=34508 RepID=A0A4U5MIQ6_STECR|nr:hypothetical protein L596_021421 [Steinernema carpocapsae]
MDRNHCCRGGGSDRIGFSGFRIGFSGSDRIQLSDPDRIGSDRIAFVRKIAFVSARSFAKSLNLNLPQRVPARRVSFVFRNLVFGVLRRD